MSTLKCFKLISKALDIFFKDLPDPSWALSMIICQSLAIIMAKTSHEYTKFTDYGELSDINIFYCGCVLTCQSVFHQIKLLTNKILQLIGKTSQLPIPYSNTRTHMHAHVSTYKIYIYIHTYTQSDTHTHACTHTRMHARTNTHTHKHINKHTSSSLTGVVHCSPHQSYSSSLYLCTANPPLLLNHLSHNVIVLYQLTCLSVMY